MERSPGMDAPPHGAPQSFSGAELIMQALNNSSAAWEAEALLRIQQVNKALREAAAAGHLWEPVFERLNEKHPCGDTPVFPRRIHGTTEWPFHHPHAQDSEACAHVPAVVLADDELSTRTRFNEATGYVEDKFHPESEDRYAVFPRTTIWLKRPAALLCCEPCGVLSFECGRSFAEHCRGWNHIQLLMAPRHLPEQLWDPRWNREAFAALTPQRRSQAIHKHVETVMAAFNAPLTTNSTVADNRESDVDLLNEYRRTIRSDVREDSRIPDERAAVKARCKPFLSSAGALAAAIREHILIRDFKKFGLVRESHNAPYSFLVEGWDAFNNTLWCAMCIMVTGLEMIWPDLL